MTNGKVYQGFRDDKKVEKHRIRSMKVKIILTLMTRFWKSRLFAGRSQGHRRPHKFFEGGQRQHLLTLFRLQAMQCKWTFTNTFPFLHYGNSHKKCAS